MRKQLRSLENEIEDRAPTRFNALPLLGQMLNLDIPDNEFTKSLEPKDRKGALHALLEDCLKAAAQDDPLLIIIEDLHWIDALSHDLLEELARATTHLPICFVLAYRPPELARLLAPRLEALPTFSKIELNELDASEAEQAIRAKLTQLYPARSGTVPPTLVDKLMARTQGNPFFLEELLNFLHDRGLDPLNLADLDKIELPDSLHSLILSRIDQLTENEKTTLRVASIVGRLFRAAWLTGYYPELGNLPRVKDDLDELHNLYILALDAPEPELTYLFKHIVTHEVTYESLPFATRARLHEQLAAYLEKLGETQHAVSLLTTIAYHYGQSDNSSKKQEYFQKAADSAQAAYANDAALDYLARLLPLLEDPRAQLELYRQQGTILELTGQSAEAEPVERAALAIAEQMADAPAIARGQYALSKLFRKRGDYAETQDWLARAQDGFAALDDRAGMAYVHIEMGNVWQRQGEYASAKQEYERALVLGRETGEQRAAALGLGALGSMAFDQGDYAASCALQEQSLALFQEIGDKRGIAQALGNLGIGVKLQGDSVTARHLYEQSLALCREMGDKRSTATLLINLGILVCDQGDYATAQTLQEQSLVLMRDMDHRQGIAYTLANLGNLAVEQDDAHSAQLYYFEGLKLGQVMIDKFILFSIFGGLAAVAVLLTDLRRTARLAAAAESLRLSIGAA